ncbi:glycosyltransferase [Candidatus Saccharibacteria bacterium]|nr:glycosyltransferase [Candidatus Saccharibacteria bacterium]
MKVAIVHDWLTNMGGAEQVVLNLHRLFPDAPIFTTFFTPENLPSEFKNLKVKTSFLQKKKPVTDHKKYFPLMPLAFKKFNKELENYDLVISISTCCAKSVKAKNGAHICYCNTPMRYAWDFREEYLKDMNPVKRFLARLFLIYMRHWDKKTAKNVDFYIANSNEIKSRIKRCYGRDSVVVNPPVRCDVFKPTSDEPGDYYLFVSRLVEYKRADLAIKACEKLEKNLIVIGDGPEREKLEKLAASHTTFLGRLSDKEIEKYLAHAKALIFPAFEDAGIVPVEAMSAGRPVIAFGKGGALDTVIDGKTGVFFPHQTVKSLMNAIKKSEKIKFDPKFIRNHAKAFDEPEFRVKIMKYVKQNLPNEKF